MSYSLGQIYLEAYSKERRREGEGKRGRGARKEGRRGEAERERRRGDWKGEEGK